MLVMFAAGPMTLLSRVNLHCRAAYLPLAPDMFQTAPSVLEMLLYCVVVAFTQPVELVSKVVFNAGGGVEMELFWAHLLKPAPDVKSYRTSYSLISGVSERYIRLTVR